MKTTMWKEASQHTASATASLHELSLADIPCESKILLCLTKSFKARGIATHVIDFIYYEVFETMRKLNAVIRVIGSFETCFVRKTEFS